MAYPDGRTEKQRLCSDQKTGCFDPGTKDRLLYPPPPQGGGQFDYDDVILEDGSDIRSNWSADLVGTDTNSYWVDHITPTQITDRHGRVTTLDWQEIDQSGAQPDLIRLVRVTDLASGRWINITYGTGNVGAEETPIQKFGTP